MGPPTPITTRRNQLAANQTPLYHHQYDDVGADSPCAAEPNLRWQSRAAPVAQGCRGGSSATQRWRVEPFIPPQTHNKQRGS